MHKKRSIADDFGSRSSGIQKPFQAKRGASIVAHASLMFRFVFNSVAASNISGLAVFMFSRFQFDGF